ncbi:plasmolipin [Pholidichthys leucotaenia]
MADFPSKVNTETSIPNSQSSQQGGNGLRGMAANIAFKIDVSFIRSIPAILMIVEIVLGLLHWALIAGANHTAHPAYGWVLFVAITLWLLTILLFFIILFSVPQRVTVIVWPLTVMMYQGVATVLYLTAFVTNAATVPPSTAAYHGHYGAAAFFGCVVTLVYGASAFLSYLDWRGDGGNAATSTVPT